MKWTFPVLCMLLWTITSCVSQSQHDKLKSEKEAITEERDRLKSELDEIKFGASNLLAEGKKFFDAKEFDQAREKLQSLVDKHPDRPESIEAKHMLSIVDEEQAWNKALVSDDISYVKIYREKYPKGKYATVAASRERDLKMLNMQKAYENAKSMNTSGAWESFLNEYPDHAEKSAIEKLIIRLKVQEIAGDSKTGKMPQFDQIGYEYSENSSVSIKNDTGCDLTVYYSGPDARIITIPIGSTRSLYLPSGNYSVAASACGENYAGTENLHGNYSSTFYISTYRY